MYDIPPVPMDAMSKFRAGDCSDGAPILDVNMGMGGKIDGIMVCSGCRRPAVVHIIRKEWIHAAR